MEAGKIDREAGGAKSLSLRGFDVQHKEKDHGSTHL
jgi:hypothetical protein